MTIAFALLAMPVAAAPLCRDSKGLFTPCPEALTKAAQRHLEDKIAALPPTSFASATPVASEPRPRLARATHARVPLCRDTKGLFTPCARP